MAPQLKRKRVLAAKIEATPGTLESLSATHGAFNAYDVMIQQEAAKTKREAPGGFAPKRSVIGGWRARLTFKLDVEWDGTATEPGWADTFLPSCGWVKSGQVFTPRTEPAGANVKTITAASYQDGVLKMIRGASGTFRLICQTGEVATLEFDYLGIWVPVTDAAIIAPTYPTAKGLRFANSTTQWDSVALCLSNLTLDTGNEVELLECPTDVSGFGYAAIRDRTITVTGDPEAKLVAEQDRYGDFFNMEEGALTWDLDGPTNSKITIAAPKAELQNIQEADRAKIVTDDITWQCNRNDSAVDQEASITFTAAT